MLFVLIRKYLTIYKYVKDDDFIEELVKFDGGHEIQDGYFMLI